MSNRSLSRIATVLAGICAAGLFLASLKLPVWHLKMEAPQYQEEEALRVRVYPGSMSGDLREIKVLNKYIGVRIPERLPQLQFLPIALVCGAGLGLGAMFLPRRFRGRALITVACLLSLSMAVSAGLAQYQMHEIGHDRDPHAALKGVHDFTPPLIGEVKIANFEIKAGLGIGALLIAGGIVLQLAAARLSSEPRHNHSPVGRVQKRSPASVQSQNDMTLLTTSPARQT